MGIKRGARILIVDDHEDNVELLQARLEARGFRTETATDGQQALDRVAIEPPELARPWMRNPTSSSST